ncbi:hypothetical protein ACFE04_006865 [Oxalis oulophora]
MAVTSVKVSNVSLAASESDIIDFFSFSGEIENVEFLSDNEQSRTAYISFKDAQGAETAVLLSGAKIVDKLITVELAPDYNPPAVLSAVSSEGSENKEGSSSASTIRKAEDVVSSMLAKGFILGKDVIGKAKEFDEKHQLTSTTTSKMKEMDEKFQVSEKTKSAIAVAGQKASNAGSAVMKNRYVLIGATWAVGAFKRVSKRAENVGQQTKEKVSAEEKEQENTRNVERHSQPALMEEEKAQNVEGHSQSTLMEEETARNVEGLTLRKLKEPEAN